MPHDKNGEILQPGDVVSMDFIIREIHNTEEYCNLNLESVLKLYPTDNSTLLSAVNAKQVYKK